MRRCCPRAGCHPEVRRADGEEVESEQVNRLKDLKAYRDDNIVKEKLDIITKACNSGDNLIPLIIDASQSYATLGEIVDSMKKVFGEWNENITI